MIIGPKVDRVNRPLLLLVKFLKNFGCRYCLVTVYTMQPATILSPLGTVVSIQFNHVLQNLIDLFYFEENNKQTKKPVNPFLQDDATASIRLCRPLLK